MYEFSCLAKTWLVDVDGTILKHNGHLNGGDILLDGAKNFIENIDPRDKIILMTARREMYKDDLEIFLKLHEIRFDIIIYDATCGERILINDKKPSGLDMAYAINVERDGKLEVSYRINERL